VRQAERIAQFARSVARECQPQFVAGDARAVVGNLDRAQTAAADGDRNARCAGVEGVLDQFLDDRYGTFDDFARGDLSDRGFVEKPDHAGSFPRR